MNYSNFHTFLAKALMGLALALFLTGCSTSERYYLPGQTQLSHDGIHQLGEADESPEPQLFFMHAAGWLLWPTEEADPGSEILSKWLVGVDRDAMVAAVEAFPNRKVWDSVELEAFLRSQDMDLTVLIGLREEDGDGKTRLRLAGGESIEVERILEIAREAGVGVVVYPLSPSARVGDGLRTRSAWSPFLEHYSNDRRVLSDVDRLRDPDDFRWYPLTLGFHQSSAFERVLAFRDSNGMWWENRLTSGWNQPIELKERRENSEGEVNEFVEEYVPYWREQVQTHPRFQMPVEVDFTALLGASFQEARSQPNSEKWLERYRTADRSTWWGEWPEKPDRSPSEVLYQDAPGNFYAQWYRGWPTGWYEKTYPAYVSGLFLLEDLLVQSGREAEIADQTARFHVAWAVICGDRNAEWPQPPPGGWPEPMGDLLEVLAAGSRAAPEHPAFQRLRDWMRRTEVGPDALALPLANFVVGLGLLRDAPDAAAEHFQAVRQSVRAGVPDWDHLAVQSWGWEGAAALWQGEILAAWELYVDGNVAGFSDLPSLIRVYREMLYQEDDFLEPLAFVPQLTWSLLLFTLREPPRYGRIPMEEEKERFGDLMFESIPVNPPLGPIMAMLAERRGEPERRQIWLEESFEDDPLAWYLHYRDALQAGEIEEALDWQDRILFLWSENDWENWQDHFLWPHLRVGGELLPRSLARDRAWLLALQGEFVQSVPWFLVAEPPTAMAIGERLLTTAEIREVQDRLDNDTDAVWQTFAVNSFADWQEVLFRRLAREGEWREAAEVLPADREMGAIDQILPHLEALESMADDPEQQAEQLFAASRAIRDHGAFSGTLHVRGIIHDDGRFYSGVRMYSMRRMRGQSFIDEVPFRLPADWIDERLAATKDTSHLHGRTYRYAAADLAWQAAELLPENNERAADMLWHGGVWLMYIDSEAANRFYQALVRRHPETELGRAATEIRWFPSL